VYARIEHIRSPSDMATSEEGVPSDEGAQAVGGAPAEETASDDIDCRRAASSEGGAGMDDGAGVRAKDRIVERSIARYGSPPPLRPCILSVYHALTLPWRCNT
jgi:hypothetical protein